jgi:methionyl-tRNA formyltransferase
MKIVIITQEDRFFLPDCINVLLSNLNEHHHVCAAVVSDVSPFGKKETLFAKVKKTLAIFGFSFTFRWAIRFALAILRRKSVTPVLQRHNVDILNLSNSINHKDSLAKIRSYKPDLLISIAGNEIFKQPLINLAPKGCLNLHTALLPKYRGLMPSFWALRFNEKYTGVSVFKVDEGIDSGPIVVQKRIEINGDSQEQLIVKTKRLGMTAVIEAVARIENGDVNFLANDDADMTYFSFPKKSDVHEFLSNGNRFF